MLCYLPWDVKVVVNDINGNLTNLYMVIRDSPSDFVNVPYSEVAFQMFTEDLKSDDFAVIQAVTECGDSKSRFS